MADNGLTGTAVGLIWDGTGLGTDGTVWGSECLIGGYEGYTRFGSIRPIPLIGGDRVTKEPLRVAYALLLEAGCDATTLPEAESLALAYRSGINCPRSSGMGRLFDGVSALLGICTRCSYEGQGAVLLEAYAGESEESYPICFTGGEFKLFDWRPMIRELIRERDEGCAAGIIAAKFMNTLVRMGSELAAAACAAADVNDVVLSGGTFQNMYLMHRLPDALRARGLTPWVHSRVAPNDEGLSLGQLMIAQAEGQKYVSCNSTETD